MLVPVLSSTLMASRRASVKFSECALVGLLIILVNASSRNGTLWRPFIPKFKLYGENVLMDDFFYLSEGSDSFYRDGLRGEA